MRGEMEDWGEARCKKKKKVTAEKEEKSPPRGHVSLTHMRMS